MQEKFNSNSEAKYIMNIQKNISLKQYNTFGIDASAKSFATFSSIDELEEGMNYSLSSTDSPLVLGGGSNILFTKDYEGLVLKNELKGIEVYLENQGNAGSPGKNLQTVCRSYPVSFYWHLS